MKNRYLVAGLFLLSSIATASAQSNPGLSYGQVPTAGQWNSYFSAKQDVLGYLPLPITGGTMTGKLTLAASNTSNASLNIPPSVAPASPNNGDVWETTAGIFARVNGTTIGPLSGPSGGSFAATLPLSVSFPAGVTTYACAICAVTTNPLSQFSATTSAQLLGVISDETGTGPLVFGTSPSISAPVLSGTITGTYTLGGTPSISGGSINSGIIAGTYGGTGVNNGARTITAGGNWSSTSTVSITGAFSTTGAFATAAAVTHAGAFAQTITATGITNSTLPAGTHTLAGLDVAQTWTALQGFADNDFGLNGSTSGNLILRAAAISASSVIRFPAGSTDFSATGGTSQVVRQSSAGAALTVGQLAFSDISGTIATGQVSGSYTGITGVGALAAGSLAAGFTPITNALLANSSTTVNGQTCSLGGTCTITATAASVTVGTTTVTGGPGLLFNSTSGGTLAAVTTANNSVLVTNGSGVFSMSTTLPSGLAATNMALTTPTIGAASGTSLALGGATIGTNALAITGTTLFNSAITYGGVALSNSVTGTGSMALSASPAFTGVPTVPTATIGNNTTQIASTAFVQAAVAASTTGVASLNGQTGNLAAVIAPQGRLTLASLTPVMTTTQASKTRIYYTPYVGSQATIYDGSNLIPTTFSEISVSTTDTTKNPAAIGANKVNDWFVWNDSGTLRLSHGPDWTNDTTRSAGTALVLVNGILLNNASITNGPAASRGTYVGTTRSDGSSQLNWIIGGSAYGGTAGFLGVWNMYNRVISSAASRDSGAVYSYATAAVQQARASAGNQVSFVSGLSEDYFTAIYSAAATAAGGASASAVFGIGFDSLTTITSTRIAAYSVVGALSLAVSSTNYSASSLGYHVVSANEIGDGTNGNGFDNTSDNTLTFNLRM